MSQRRLTLWGSSRVAVAFTLLLAAAVPCLAAPAARLAPAFTLVDAGGIRRSSAAFRGRPVALYFYCGCRKCVGSAHSWALLQNAGALTVRSGRPKPVTLVVFAGDALAATEFAAQTGLDKHETVLLPDPDMHVTRDLYGAQPCPRVFVIDTGGRISYTNSGPSRSAGSDESVELAALAAIRRAGEKLSSGGVTLTRSVTVTRSDPAMSFVACHPFAVEKSPGIAVVQPYEANYDFGRVASGVTQPVERDFVLRNRAAGPVTITRIQPSCSCTTAVSDNGADGVYTPIPPGGTLTIHVSVDTRFLYPGHIVKEVWVFLDGAVDPAATLRIVGDVTRSGKVPDPVTNIL